MAERRMFAKAVINSARFLRMPQTSRLLYYDLGMSADDDGIVEAFTVIRTTGAAEDDLRVLASRGFITVLNEDLVSYITDWKQNNFIRPDRYHPSVHTELLVKIADGDQRYTDGIPMVAKRETEVRLGKDRIVKGSIEESGADKPPRAPRFSPPSIDEIAEYCKERGNSIDPQRFFDFYSAKNWMIGKNKMVDWRASVRTWEKREGDAAHGNASGSSTDSAGNSGKTSKFNFTGRKLD